jgi:hypothetical protein
VSAKEADEGLCEKCEQYVTVNKQQQRQVKIDEVSHLDGAQLLNEVHRLRLLHHDSHSSRPP